MPAFNLTQGAAYIVITAVTGLIYTLLVWFIRLFIRIKINPPFGWDDIHCTIATVFTLLDSSLILSQTRYGLGQHAWAITPHAANTQRVLGWLAVLCYVQASCFSILSITFLLVRVTRLTSQARPAYLVAGATGLWCLIATTIILFQCRLPQPWRTRPHIRCIDIYAAWVFITTSRALIESANVAIAARLLWRLRMPIRPKITIIAMFALRLLVLPPVIMRLLYIRISWQSADWSYARINVQIITQVALHVSTILCTIPCTKNFLLVFETHPPPPGPTAATMQTQDNNRRVSKRKSSAAPDGTAQNSSGTSRTRPTNSRRTKSDYDLVRMPSSTRPGPIHTLRMNSWSAPCSLRSRGTPMGPEPGVRSIATAEHDPYDAKLAAVERRKSAESDDSRRTIKRTHSYRVDWRDCDGEGSQAQRWQRQGSMSSWYTFEEVVEGNQEA